MKGNSEELLSEYRSMKTMLLGKSKRFTKKELELMLKIKKELRKRGIL